MAFFPGQYNQAGGSWVDPSRVQTSQSGGAYIGGMAPQLPTLSGAQSNSMWGSMLGDQWTNWQTAGRPTGWDGAQAVAADPYSVARSQGVTGLPSAQADIQYSTLGGGISQTPASWASGYAQSPQSAPATAPAFSSWPGGQHGGDARMRVDARRSARADEPGKTRMFNAAGEYRDSSDMPGFMDAQAAIKALPIMSPERTAARSAFDAQYGQQGLLGQNQRSPGMGLLGNGQSGFAPRRR